MENNGFVHDSNRQPSWNGYGVEASSDGAITQKPKLAKCELRLERSLGLFSAVSLIVGTIIGSGIFIAPGFVIEQTESVGLCLVVWVAGGVLAMLGALTYAELGTTIPKSGGNYIYLLESYGSFHRFWGQLPAFLFLWLNAILLIPAGWVVVVLSFAEYTVNPIAEALGVCEDASELETVKTLIAWLCLFIVTVINCRSTVLAARVQNVFTSAKLLAIAVIILIGLYNIIRGHFGSLAEGFAHSTSSPGNIATAFYSTMFAYNGWSNLNYVIEELQNPTKNLPRAIIISIPLVATCYFLVNVAYFTVLTPEEIINSKAVAVDFGQKTLGNFSFLIPLAVAMSTFGALNGGCFVSARLCFVAARQGHMIDVLSYVDVRRLTPSPSIMFTVGVAMIMLMLGNVNKLIDFISFSQWIFYALTMIGLLSMRISDKTRIRPYKVHIVIPCLVFVMSLFLVFAPIIQAPQFAYLYSLVFMGIGVVVYTIFIHRGVSPQCLGGLTRQVQLLLEVAQPAKSD